MYFRLLLPNEVMNVDITVNFSMGPAVVVAAAVYVMIEELTPQELPLSMQEHKERDPFPLHPKLGICFPSKGNPPPLQPKFHILTDSQDKFSATSKACRKERKKKNLSNANFISHNGVPDSVFTVKGFSFITCRLV